MMDLIKLHKAIVDELNNNNITESEASELYDKLFDEQVNDLILDIYEAFDNKEISDSEANAYLGIAIEAVKGDKLSNKAEDKIDSELKHLPDKERKAVEDSIRKAAKESDKRGTAFKVTTLNSIDKALKSKKKAVKESADEILDLDAELALFEESSKYNIDIDAILDIAIVSTITAVIATPFVFTFGRILKANKEFKKSNEYSDKCKKIARELEDLREEANKKVDELNRKYNALYKKAPLINKYYIPKEKKSEMESLKAKFAKLQEDYNEKKANLEAEYKKSYRLYEDAISGSHKA